MRVRKFLALSAAIVALLLPCLPAQASSVFVKSTDNSSFYAIGDQSTISGVPLNGVSYDNHYVSMFPATVMANGDFYQVGWQYFPSASPCSSKLGVFVQAYTHLGLEPVNRLFCQETDPTRTFTMYRSTTVGMNGIWDAYASGIFLSGSAFTTSPSAGHNAVYLQCEILIGNDTRDACGPNEYTALQYIKDDGLGWRNIATADTSLPGDTTCPIYGVHRYGTNDIGIGSIGAGLECYPNGTGVW